MEKLNKKKSNIEYSPLFIAGVYIAVSILWIVFSDKAVDFIAGYTGWSLSQLQTMKGGFFVIATGIMIYSLIKSRLVMLEKSEYRYRALFESAGDGVFLFDREGIVDFNQRAMNLFKYTNKKMLLGKQPWELSPPFQPDGRSSEESAKEKIDLALSGIPQVFEWQHINSEGGIIEGSISLSLVNAEKKTVVAIFRDMTEFRKISDQLQQSGKMQAIGNLAGGIAHDFNNILSAIIGYAELSLDEAGEKQPVKLYIENIIKAGNRAGQLVSQILSFSRQSNEEKKSVNLVPVVNEVIELFKASFPSTVSVEFILEGDVSPVIADPVKIHEVLMNLSANAVSAMNEKGLIKIVLRNEKVLSEIQGVIGTIYPRDYTLLEVHDSGKGMNKSVITRIFEPFYTSKEASKGTGLGLSVVYGIMQSHDGDILVESIPGEGTVFRLFFPETDKTPALEKTDNNPVKKGDERILFVDDEEVLAELGRSMLSSLGYTVTSLTDSRKAYKMLTSSIKNYDLLITDQTMPYLTGIELASKIHEIKPDFPVILCTGFSTKVNEQNAGKAGLRGFAYKPLSKQQLAEIVRNVLDNCI